MSFLYKNFIKHMSGCYNNFKNASSSYVFDKYLIEVVRGETAAIYPPNRKWIKNVDVISGVLLVRQFKRWIGIAINLKKRTITFLDCESPTEKRDLAPTHVQPFAGIIYNTGSNHI